MIRMPRLVRGLLMLSVLVGTMVAPAAVFADGEVGDMGDTDSITDLSVNGSDRVQAKVDFVHDCPTGLSGCWIEYRYLYQCPEAWCVTWSDQGWRALPSPVNGVSTFAAQCNGGGDTDNRWKLEIRMHWWANTKKTVTLKGEVEYYHSFSGGLTTRIIVEALYNQTNSAGFSGGTTVETVTATDDYSNALLVATSGVPIFHTC